MIYGEAIVNGDFIVKRADRELERVAFTGGKLEQLRMINENLPEDIWVTSLAASAIPYALERGEIDGAVLDVSKIKKLQGNYEMVPLQGRYVTYVLVVRKDLLIKKEFKSFVENYNRVIEREENNDDISIENGKELEIRKWKVAYMPLKTLK